jgi:hypothetical protein
MTDLPARFDSRPTSWSALAVPIRSATGGTRFSGHAILVRAFPSHLQSDLLHEQQEDRLR